MDNKKSHSRFTSLTEVVVIGTRTTGSDPQRDRVVEVAAMKVDFTTLEQDEKLEINYFNRRVNPEQPIPKKAKTAGGISDRKVRNEAPFRKIAEEFREFIGDRPIIGHDAGFHTQILHEEFKRAGRKGLMENPVYCTKTRIAHYLSAVNAQNMDLPLEKVLRWFSIINDSGKLEGAFEDAYLTLKLAVALRAIDDLPGSARERWEHYFDNFQAPVDATGKKDHRPWTRNDSRLADVGNKIGVVLTRTLKFFVLFMLGFLLAAIFLRIL